MHVAVAGRKRKIFASPNQPAAEPSYDKAGTMAPRRYNFPSSY